MQAHLTDAHLVAQMRKVEPGGPGQGWGEKRELQGGPEAASHFPLNRFECNAVEQPRGAKDDWGGGRCLLPPPDPGLSLGDAMFLGKAAARGGLVQRLGGAELPSPDKTPSYLPSCVLLPV